MSDLDYNKGKPTGFNLIMRSLDEFGAGRSILVDKNGNVISGGHVLSAAKKLGLKLKIIETSGDELVVVKRVDLCVDERNAKYLSLLDNLACEKNLDWNAHSIIQEMHNDIGFDPRKYGGDACIIDDLDITELFRDDVPVVEKKTKKTIDDEPPKQMTLFDI